MNLSTFLDLEFEEYFTEGGDIVIVGLLILSWAWWEKKGNWEKTGRQSNTVKMDINPEVTNACLAD